MAKRESPKRRPRSGQWLTAAWESLKQPPFGAPPPEHERHWHAIFTQGAYSMWDFLMRDSQRGILEILYGDPSSVVPWHLFLEQMKAGLTDEGKAALIAKHNLDPFNQPMEESWQKYRSRIFALAPEKDDENFVKFARAIFMAGSHAFFMAMLFPAMEMFGKPDFKRTVTKQWDDLERELRAHLNA